MGGQELRAHLLSAMRFTLDSPRCTTQHATEHTTVTYHRFGLTRHNLYTLVMHARDQTHRYASTMVYTRGCQRHQLKHFEIRIVVDECVIRNRMCVVNLGSSGRVGCVGSMRAAHLGERCGQRPTQLATRIT